MQITVPTFTHGTLGAVSVLELEPFLHFARQCRPDAVSLMPPLGADDQPNAAALLAIKGRLEEEQMKAHAGVLLIEREAPVLSPAWQTQNLFEARALVAALGEASVEPLILDWQPPLLESLFRDALSAFLERLLEEAGRAGVRVALRASISAAELRALLELHPAEWLGACWDASPASARIAPESDLEVLRGRLTAVSFRSPQVLGPNAYGALAPCAHSLRALLQEGFSGPLLIDGQGSPVEYAHAVGVVRGVLAAVA